jgi:hypothetical protein
MLLATSHLIVGSLSNADGTLRSLLQRFVTATD